MTTGRLTRFNRAVDWLARHRDGEPVRQIAESAGVSMRQVDSTLAWAKTNGQVVTAVEMREGRARERQDKMMNEVDN